MASLPSYVAAAQPVPKDKRVPWYMTTAQTYASIMLWFAFWATVPYSDAPRPEGILALGLGPAILGVVVGALICHFCFFLVPGLLGMKTGLPLAVVGTSTYGVQGGLLMPGFLMGVLQFGWLAVNAYFSSLLLARCIGQESVPAVQLTIGIVWAIAAALVGLKGISYVAKVATFLPLLPLVILLILTAMTISGVGSFKPDMLPHVLPDGTSTAAHPPVGALALICFAAANIVGFFATAGAAGVDIASSNRNEKDVSLGGLAGVAGATIFTGCLALLIVAGTFGAEHKLVATGPINDPLSPTDLMTTIVGPRTANIFNLLLVLSAFPGACFSALVAAASFKNTMPKVNPFISCGIGTLVSIILVVTGVAGNAVDVFKVIGASFGPICGAMAADYLLAGRKWAGPRAGFNPAGWISWAVGFAVGAFGLVAKHVGSLEQYKDIIPAPPVAAFVVGFVLYIILAKAGLESQKLEHPAVKGQ
jgi:cytosine permease